jgi:hypothetical protein
MMLDFLRMGLMERHRIERGGSTPLGRFAISFAGGKVLVIHDNDDPSEERDSP